MIKEPGQHSVLRPPCTKPMTMPFDEMTEVSGSGWAELDGPGDLAGEFSFHFGDETSFRVWRW